MENWTSNRKNCREAGEACRVTCRGENLEKEVLEDPDEKVSMGGDDNVAVSEDSLFPKVIS